MYSAVFTKERAKSILYFEFTTHESPPLEKLDCNQEGKETTEDCSFGETSLQRPSGSSVTYTRSVSIILNTFTLDNVWNSKELYYFSKHDDLN